jgi:hypothetical protein
LYVTFYPDATLQSFDKLVDVLVARKPDFIVIQDAVLVIERPGQQVSMLYTWARSYWVGQIYGLARNLGGDKIVPVDDQSWRCGSRILPRSNWPADVQGKMVRISPFSSDKKAEATRFLSPFLEAGIPVLVAGPPTNGYTIEYRTRMLKVVSELLDANPPLPGVSLHWQSELSPADNFLDPLHIMPARNQPYRDWLNSEIVRVLQERKNQ